MAVNVGTLEALLRLRDQLSPALKTAATNMQNAGRSMRRTGTILTATVTAPILGAAAAAVKLSVDAEETANKFDVVMGPAAGRLRDRFEELTAFMPLTRAEMEAMTAGLQDMLVPMGVSRDLAAELSVQTLELAGDIGSFNNVATTDVLEAFKSALAGQSRPMRRFGIDTREASLQTVALQEGLLRAGQQMTETVRAQAVLIQATRQSADAIGDQERTVMSTANQMRLMWRDVRQLGQTIGDDLIPVVRGLVARAREWLDWFSKLDPATRQLAIKIALVAAAVGPLLIVLGTLISVGGTVVSAVGGIVSALSGTAGLIALALAVGVAAGTAARKFADWAQESDSLAAKLLRNNQVTAGWLRLLSTDVLADWADHMGLYGESIQDIRASTETLVRQQEVFDDVQARISSNVVRGTTVFRGVAAAIGGPNPASLLSAMERASGVGETMNRTVLDLAFTLGNPLRDKAIRAKVAIAELADGIDATIPAFEDASTTATEFGNVLDTVGSGLASGFGRILDGITGSLRSFGEGTGFLKEGGGFDFFGGIKNIGSGFVEGLGQMLSGGIASLISKGISLLTSALGKLFGALFKKANVKDHARKFFGLELSEGLTKAIEDVRDQVKGRDIEAAIRLKLGDIIDEKGIANIQELNKFTGMTRDIFSLLDRGFISTKQAGEALDGTFMKLVEANRELGGAATDQIRELIELRRQFGVTSKEITGFVLAQSNAMVAGMDAFVAAGINSQAQADLVATTLLTSFGEMQAEGLAAIDILRNMEGPLAALQESGFQLGEEMQFLADFAAKLGDEGVAKIVDSVAGLNAALTATADLGLLNEEHFDQFGAVAVERFNEMIAAGLTQQEALAAMGPTLENLRDLAARFGLSIDEGTQAIIDQAVEAGTLPPAMEPVESIMGDIRDILVLIGEHFGVTLPDAVRRFKDAAIPEIDSIGGALDDLNRLDIRPRIAFDIDNLDISRFIGGKGVQVVSGQTHPGEFLRMPGGMNQPTPFLIQPHGGEILGRPEGKDRTNEKLLHEIRRLSGALRRQQASISVTNRDSSLMGL